MEADMEADMILPASFCLRTENRAHETHVFSAEVGVGVGCNEIVEFARMVDPT